LQSLASARALFVKWSQEGELLGLVKTQSYESFVWGVDGQIVADAKEAGRVRLDDGSGGTLGTEGTSLHPHAE
jgi:hypothetical protein